MIILTLLTTGCLNTFYPIFTSENLIPNEKIIGKWEHENETLVVTRYEKGSQHLPFADKALVITGYNSEKREEFRNFGYLVKIGNHHFLDMFPDLTPAELKIDPTYLSLFLKQHIIYRVDSLQTGNRLTLQRVSDKLIMQQIEQKKIRIPMVSREEGSIILARTEQLQTHILKYANDPSIL